jgi:hypothetical protein
MDSQPASCKIIVYGPLNERWADYLGDMLLTLDVADGHIQATTLIGQPRDLAAYIGMLNAIANLGLTVIATEYWQAVPGESVVADSAVSTLTV